ncbi:MAG: serine protease [Burkholderiaceae bacterium]
MKNLQEATERICELKGSLVALDALLPALIKALPASVDARLLDSFEAHAEAARTIMLHTDISELVLTTFERDVARNRAVLLGSVVRDDPGARIDTIDPLLLTTTRIDTFAGSRPLTSASGFFFRRDHRLFVVSSRHVFADARSSHHPNRIEIALHTDPQDPTRFAIVSLPLYRDGVGLWHESSGDGSAVDVAAIEIPAARLPAETALQAFDQTHLEPRGEDIMVGDALTIPGFPIGLHDAVHHLPVARSASIASAYGVRFRQQDCFLTDGRTHRGSDGAPVVRRRSQQRSDASALPWLLMGVHSTRPDTRGGRDPLQDESQDLNRAWYADVLMTLTGENRSCA